MNDVPVVAAPPARDHAPPDRGQEPAPSDAFAAALGAAQPAEAPPPAADLTARTAPAEGTKAEGDSSGPDTKKQPDDAAAPALALIVPVPLPQAAAPDAGQPAAAPAPAAAVAPVQVAPAGTPAQAATTAGQGTAAGRATPGGDRPAIPVEAPAASPAPPPSANPAGPAAQAEQAQGPAEVAAPPAAAETIRSEEAAEEATDAVAAPRAPQGRAARRPAAARPAQAEHAVHAGRPQHPAATTRPAHAQDAVPVARGTAPVQAADAPAASPAPAHAAAPADAQAPVTARTAEPARIDERPAPAQPQADARPRVRLRDVPEVAHATLRVAVRQNGAATARISLHPADLGGVRITMRVHDGTVAATLAAETPAAAAALTQTATDLRRSLESQGLQVTSLDVHVAGDGPAANGERRHASDLAQAMGTTDRATSEDVVDITTELHLVPLGTQVDVLA